ncbi:MAG: hypothetical protein GY761_18385, partial [Hyphomicrobiales bacterium]|nr:hypothetical protein [Hyphomicrobiales bacterium]
EKTTKEFRGLWDPGDDYEKDGKFVFNRRQIDGRHIWIDKFMTSTMGILISNEMHDALMAAKITGMGFNSFEETNDVP